ncbi:MAG: ATP-binding protein [Tepidibacter sp.]|jgi:AAA15 family ATPase/GTPase|uniref:AAA family ATPase n=1 Tax=Tepidibacter sp. TaxID=2529387 RepID=UPI0025D06174|nr:ATP-binding protein [Tepidibacter sp.]MCT4508825.1 ATP-binding protein [Tepidibacter sp.]
MLSQFTFKNYKCFKDETILDMQAVTITELEDTIIKDKKDGERFIPVASIYGPNGSGKSTVLEAIWHLTSKIMFPIVMFENTEDKENITQNNTMPFMLDDISKDEPTEFHIIFRYNDTEFNYYISFLENKILNESLYKINIGEKKESEIFYRGENEIKNGSLLKSVSKTEISSKMPYLSFLKINYNISIINEVIEWFGKCDYSHYGKSFEERHFFFPKDNKGKELIISVLNEMDIDINDIEIKKDDKDKIEDIITIRNRGSEKYPLSFFDESSGTIKVITLLPKVLDSIVHGKLMIIDELDAKLHPKLLRYIINLFKNPEINKFGAQLIFTSHDLTIMKNDLFRRDEIWFTAKNKNDVSELYSLIELRDEKGELIRKNSRFDKQYLEGRYGADPYFRSIIDWEVLLDE